MLFLHVLSLVGLFLLSITAVQMPVRKTYSIDQSCDNKRVAGFPGVSVHDVVAEMFEMARRASQRTYFANKPPGDSDSDWNRVFSFFMRMDPAQWPTPLFPLHQSWFDSWGEDRANFPPKTPAVHATSMAMRPIPRLRGSC